MHVANRVRQAPTVSKAATALPAPLLSSRYRNWNGIAVELHHFRGVDALVPMREHVVGVHVAGSVSLRQTRGRRTCVQHVRAGDITITPSGEPKHFQHAGENVVILLKIAPPFVQQVAGDEYALDPARFELRENFGSPDPELVTIGKQLLAGLEPEGEVGAMQVESLTIRLVLHLLRHYCTASLPGTKRIPNLSPRRLQRVLEFIDVNLRDGISLAELAQVLAMSTGHFAHAFRQTTGLPPHRFVLERRIERAKSLLRDTDMPITEIAQHVGCASHSHLSVMFHRKTGLTPRNFRNQF
jgi:AraC family transcriptional regulator